MKIKDFLIITCLFFAQINLISSQDLKRYNYTEIDPAKIFEEIAHGLSEGEVAPISLFFGAQIYISLPTGASGYYSSNQAYYVLQNFFNVYKVVTYKTTFIGTGNSPYSTGVLTYVINNKRGTAQVFISLEGSGNNWRITQLTIR